MKFLIIILIFILLIIIFKIKNKGWPIDYVKSDIDNEDYLVQDRENKNEAANMLAKIKENILLITSYMKNNINNYKNNELYINRLNNRIYQTKFSEGQGLAGYTSYTINKGDEIIFCLRDVNGKMHDINLVMYVVLHEIAHVACPEQGHTELFNKIFAFFVQIGISIGIYQRIDFYNTPINYCGLMITDSII